jgi:glutathione gamma-glutamylcysteinyltransferase
VTQPSFYRRPLPEALVAFSSPEGKALFREALAAGTMEGYFSLAEQFHTQSDPAFCGLGTLVVALNALGVDPGRLWKGPWRWYSEEMLDCCAPLDQVRERGVTLEQLACLARCNGASAEVRRAGEEGPGRLREAIIEASRSHSGPVIAASYSRKALGQTGDGHYSPVAGYHEGRDLALLLDVARFKYPPHWIPVPLLWEAMRPADPTTGKSRGYVLLRRGELPPSLYYTLSLARCSWPELSLHLFDALPAAVREARPSTLGETIEAAVKALPTSICDAASTLGSHLESGLDPEHRAQAEALREALVGTAIFAEVSRALAGSSCCAGAGRRERAELLTVLLLVAAPALAAGLEEPAAAALREACHLDTLPAGVASEIERLRAQVEALTTLG